MSAVQCSTPLPVPRHALRLQGGRLRHRLPLAAHAQPGRRALHDAHHLALRMDKRGEGVGL